MKQIVIIGAGMAGLSAAAYLARRGFSVTLLEQQSHLGGYVTSFRRGEYPFEATTHQILGIRTPGYVDDVFRAVGLQDIEWIKADHLNEFVLFENRTIQKRYLLPADFRQIQERLESDFPRFKADLRRLFSIERHITAQGLTLMRLTKKLNLLPHLLDAVFALMLKRRSPVLRKLGKLRYPHIAGHVGASYDALLTPFDGPDGRELSWLLSQYWIYLGVPPGRVSAIVQAIVSYLFYTDGPYMVRGGTAKLAEALGHTITANGGTIVTNDGARRIEVENHRAVGVITNKGAHHPCDIVISAANPYGTFFEMVGREQLPPDYCESIDRQSLSPSVFQVYLGVPFSLDEFGFHAPTTFFSSTLDGDASYASIGSGVGSDATPFMMSGYANLDPRKPSVTLLEYDRFENWSELESKDKRGSPLDRRAYEAKKLEAQDALIRKAAALTGVPLDQAEVTFSATPLTFKRYTASPAGCVLSSELVPDQSFARRLSAETPIRGLYLTGSFVAGPGITSCISSGVRTSNEIIRKEKL